MAEHRRVEPHIALVGTGMAVDGERIAAIEDEAERRARAWREAPERGFGDVLHTAPARGHLEDEEEPDPRRRPKVEPAERAGLAADALKTNDAGSGPARAGAGPGARANLPRVPPDPRQAMLERKLAAAHAPDVAAAPRPRSPSAASIPAQRDAPAPRSAEAPSARTPSARTPSARTPSGPATSSAPAERAMARPRARSTAAPTSVPAPTESPLARSRAPAPIALDDAQPEATPPTGKTGRPH